MKKIILLICVISLTFGQDQRELCGTPPMPQEQIRNIKLAVEQWLLDQDRDDPEPVHVLVAWHVIHTNNGVGNYGDEAIYTNIEYLNQTFAPYFVSFTVDSIDRTENNQWFNNWYDDVFDGCLELHVDPYHYLNIYTANLYADGVAGFSYLGNGFGPSDYRQSVNLDYRELAWGNDVNTHEVGHHMGLPHTFSSSCSVDGDGITDTPRHHEDYLWQCSESLDSCPDQDGNDPIHNYMTYTSSSCQDEFSDGQQDWMHYIIENYHPGYLENSFLMPDLYLDELTFQNDTDGDGVFNPGDQIRVRANVGNAWGANADSVRLVISTEDDRLAILDSIIQFENAIEPGEVSFTLLDWFELYALPDIALGNIQCNINITTSDDENPYEIDVPIEISISLDQSGFPIDGMSIKSSPIIADLDGNNTNDIFFGSDNGRVYGYMIAGYPMYGFPFNTNGDVRSSPAVADLDNNGSEEIIFGSNDGSLYILNAYGIQLAAYGQSGSINGSPAVVDLDQDGDYEVVFTSYNGDNSIGEVHAIHHDGFSVYGFPVDLDEKMMAGAAAGDLEGDGYPEIVVCTWDDNIYAIGHDGYVKSGFPFESTQRFNAPATLVDLDGDGDLEIVAGNDSGLLHVLHHDGTEMASYDVGDDIRGGISVADLNDDGSQELLFTGYDDMIHVWNPIDGAELEGWPVDMEYNSLTEPVTADLDNDGDLEVVTAMKSGTAYVFHHDASLFDHFPTSLGGNIESSPAIGDVDGDGDFEIAFGTTNGLRVIDIKTEKGDRLSWRLHRGNLERTGSLGMTLVSNDADDELTPVEFRVSSNYPNPFNPSTKIDIETVEANDLVVSVFDATGRLVNDLVNEYLDAGRYSVRWNGMDASGHGMSTGVYFIQVRSGAEINTQKMILIK